MYLFIISHVLIFKEIFMVCTYVYVNFVLQVVHMVNFVKTFLDENPLCVCSEEIAFIKKDLITPEDEIKLKQKTSQIVLKLRQQKYFMNFNISVPDTYPLKQIT